MLVSYALKIFVFFLFFGRLLSSRALAPLELHINRVSIILNLVECVVVLLYNIMPGSRDSLLVSRECVSVVLFDLVVYMLHRCFRTILALGLFCRLVLYAWPEKSIWIVQMYWISVFCLTQLAFYTAFCGRTKPEPISCLHVVTVQLRLRLWSSISLSFTAILALHILKWLILLEVAVVDLATWV